MASTFDLATFPHVAFVPISDKDKALAFYRDILGLALIEDQSPFALVFELNGTKSTNGTKGTNGTNGTMLRASFDPGFKPQPFTILGWQVVDIALSVPALESAGVVFNRYPWMNLAEGQPAIWTAPGGARIAWFQDPFGNVLSLQQNP